MMMLIIVRLKMCLAVMALRCTFKLLNVSQLCCG